MHKRKNERKEGGGRAVEETFNSFKFCEGEHRTPLFLVQLEGGNEWLKYWMHIL